MTKNITNKINDRHQYYSIINILYKLFYELQEINK